MSIEHSSYLNKITQISSEEQFLQIALEVFDYQFENIKIYREYCRLINKTKPKQLNEIPFLPIEFFKSHKILDQQRDFTAIFKSSGTTTSQRSQHYVADLQMYEVLSKHAFEQVFGPISSYVILALLPNYLEQGDSSLVYMVDHFIRESKHEYSGFYLNDLDSLLSKIELAQTSGKSVVLFGVSYALLDLAEKQVDLQGVYVIETGGMKGRRKELPKEVLHEVLRQGLNVDTIYSEYGMTELLSQAYCKNQESFHSPSWMKILIRETNDPFSYLEQSSNKTGGVNIIDLANLYSCSFIQTQDLGRYDGNGFKLLGRFDNSDIRGCNQLIYN